MDFILDNIEKIIFFILFFILPQFFKKSKDKKKDDGQILRTGGEVEDLNTVFASDQKSDSSPSLADMLAQIKENVGQKSSKPKALSASTTTAVVQPKVQPASRVRYSNPANIYHTKLTGTLQKNDRNSHMSESKSYDDAFEAEPKNRDTAHGFHRPGEHPLEHKSYSDDIYGIKTHIEHPLMADRNLQDAFIMSEVLQKPVALRKERRF